MGRDGLRATAARLWWMVFENLVYLAFALSVIAALGAAWIASGITHHGPFEMAASGLYNWSVAPPRQVGPLWIATEYSASIRIESPERWQLLLLGLPPVVTALLTAGVTWLMWRIARTLRSGDPFVPVNARRVFLMAGCVAGYGLVVEPLRALVAVVMVRGTPAAGLIDPTWPFAAGPVGVALILATLGAVFRKGTRPHGDASGPG